MHAAELHTYMRDINGKGEFAPSSQISLLEGDARRSRQAAIERWLQAGSAARSNKGTLLDRPTCTTTAVRLRRSAPRRFSGP